MCVHVCLHVCGCACVWMCVHVFVQAYACVLRVCMCARVCAEAGAACCQLRTGNMAERTGCRRLPVHLRASTGGSFVTLGMEAWLVQV